MNKVHVIVNPFSARGKTGERWDTIRDVIRHYFREFKYIMTEKPRQATEIARGLLKDGYDLIIGVGETVLSTKSPMDFLETIPNRPLMKTLRWGLFLPGPVPISVAF